jgi:solute carrier family 25 (mitochondrial phosphate transporter), member 23/24/25/41
MIRNFLLFLPAETPELKAVLSYYTSTVKLNAEGDIVIRDETVQSLGTRFLSAVLNILFGSILRLASRPKRQQVPDDEFHQLADGLRISEAAHVPTSITPNEVNLANKQRQISSFEMDARLPGAASDQMVDSGMLDVDVSGDIKKKSSLTVFIIDPGYFAAGGIAGAVSRTATAPLDRLKVYLIANTSVAKDSLEAVKHGEPLKAMKNVGRPLIDACKELWKAGGVRSLFAGMFCIEIIKALTHGTGNGLNVIKVMPESAIKFGSYEAAKRALAQIEGHGNPQEINPYSQFVAGGLGGMFSQYALLSIFQCRVSAFLYCEARYI